ncbi:MAG: L-seryl-tRNA(Sec) selenium transferase [Candidatus Solibacter usitatus]|nr:L-seryl-tRNA(Sec) selenium transferase [Candidatus Solibacter usitatus]
MNSQDQFRLLPSVDELASSITDGFPRDVVVDVCREVLEQIRGLIRAGSNVLPDPASLVRHRLAALGRPSLRRVINATGVILHTNLGRAPLASHQPSTGYCNLEYDLATGKRGKRDSHTSGLLERLLGAPAILVNNGAAAVFLALNELAGGGEAIISRGELIEIGDGFRIPEIMSRSGAALVEVGTTNRTRIEDYRQAITLKTRLLMRVHPSNFRIQGFTGRPALEELAGLGRQRGIPLYEDLGSGCLSDLSGFGIVEPTIAQSLKAGVDLVSFSGDKLLGGPQAGILTGKPEIIQRLRRNPLFRALRLDKLVTAAMETTLRLLLSQNWAAVPVHRMIRQHADLLRVRAEQIVRSLAPGTAPPGPPALDLRIAEGRSLLGGGSTPEQTLPTWLISIGGDAVAMEKKLRLGDPPIIARIDDGRLLLDLRTVEPDGDTLVIAALRHLAS